MSEKAKEMESIRELWNMMGYFHEAFTEGDIVQMENNITTDFPLLHNTQGDIVAQELSDYKKKYIDAKNDLDLIEKNVEDLNRSIEYKDNLNEVLVLHILENDPDSDFVYKIYAWNKIVEFKLKKDFPLNDRDKKHILEQLKTT